MPIIRKKDALSPIIPNMIPAKVTQSKPQPKPMLYKEEDGNTYKISFSEELQLKNLKETKKQVAWERRNFYAKLALLAMISLLTLSILYIFYRLDAVDFFTTIMYR